MQEQVKNTKENEDVKSQVQETKSLDDSSIKTTKEDAKNEINIKKTKEKAKKIPKDKKTKVKDFTPSDLEDFRHKLDKKENAFFQKIVTKRFTKKASHAIIIKRLVSMSLALILLAITVVYLVSYTYVNAAGYGINIIADEESVKSISLSEDPSLDIIALNLKAEGIRSLDNITYDWMPIDLNLNSGGAHNGQNYIAYTFYVINTGDENLVYESALEIKHSTREVETAIRVRIFKNGVSTVYTHTYEAQNLVGDEGIDSFLENQRGQTVVEFASPTVISYSQNNLEVATHDKYTVVIWLEGEDIDCVDDKRSGELSMAWRFSVLDEE